MTASSGILNSYLIDAFTANAELRHDELLKRNLDKKGGDFLTPLSFYLDIMGNVDTVMIPYMSDERKDQLRHDLKVANLLLLAQKQYELTHQKTENRKKYDASIKQCQELLDALNPSWQKVVATAPEQIYFTDGKPVKYCGIPLAQEFVDKIMEFMDRKTKGIKEALGAFNEKRLYWVWGSAFIKTMLSLIPEDFFNAKQAGEIIKTPDPYTGALSWALYYFRFSLNLFLLLKHTIKHPWMSKEEGDTPWFDRFKAQWAQRKFTLLNDSLWGIANMVCYFWLTGKVLGPWGDALTILLLIFDVSVAIWDFAEQQAQHEAQMQQYDNDIKALLAAKKKLLTDALAKDEEEKDRKLKIYQLQMQLNALERAQAKCVKEWELQKLGLYNNIGYAVGLTIAFVLMTMPFMPITAATALTLGVVGAVLCFALTVIASAIRGGIEIYKSKEAIKDAKRGFADHVGLLKAMLIKNPNLNDNEKKLLYLEIKKYQAETEYQKKMVMFQSIHLVRSIIIEAFVPAIIFSCLVFLPMGIGFAALGAALGLAIVSNLLINALFKPNEKMKELAPFDAKEDKKYEEFCRLVTKGSDTKAQHAFFKAKKVEEVVKTEQDVTLDTDPGLGLNATL